MTDFDFLFILPLIVGIVKQEDSCRFIQKSVNTSNNDAKTFATDLKTIYQAVDEKKALAALERVTEKWTPKYLNSTYRKLNRQRSVFPSDTALLKALYLATFEATKKWTMSIRNWGQVYGELSIMYEGRLPE